MVGVSRSLPCAGSQKMKFRHIALITGLLAVNLTHAAKAPKNPAKQIQQSDEALISCQFAVLPWLVGQSYRYDADEGRMVLSKAPEMPQLYYPSNGKMIPLKLEFKHTSDYYSYHGPESLGFYLKVAATGPNTKPTWKPLVLTKLSPKSKQILILLDFKQVRNGLTQGIPLRCDPQQVPKGSIMFINASSVPIITRVGEDTQKLPPYGQSIFKTNRNERDNLTVKAATVVNKKPKVILNQSLMAAPDKRMTYIIYPTNQSMRTWRTKSVALDLIVSPQEN